MGQMVSNVLDRWVLRNWTTGFQNTGQQVSKVLDNEFQVSGQWIPNNGFQGIKQWVPWMGPNVATGYYWVLWHWTDGFQCMGQKASKVLDRWFYKELDNGFQSSEHMGSMVGSSYWTMVSKVLDRWVTSDWTNGFGRTGQMGSEVVDRWVPK